MEREYTVMRDEWVPFGLAYNSPVYGLGGGEQVFVKDYKTELKLEGRVDLDQHPEICEKLKD